MLTAKIIIQYKPSILDPQGEAIMGTLKRLDYPTICDIRGGKYFEIQISEDEKNPEKLIEELCEKLLVNPNMEEYHYEIVGEIQ